MARALILTLGTMNEAQKIDIKSFLCSEFVHTLCKVHLY
jgi:hypothetical protein